jgi:hypothetical protein
MNLEMHIEKPKNITFFRFMHCSEYTFRLFLAKKCKA